MFETLKVDVRGAIGELQLDRPEKLNPLSIEALEEVAAAARYFDTIEEAFSYTRVDLAIDLAYSSARERWIYGIFLWPKLGPRAVAIV